MRSDGPGADDGPDDESNGDGECGGRRAVRSDGGPHTGHRPTGKGTDRGVPTRQRPDRGAWGGRPREGSRGKTAPTLDETCPVTAAIRAADLGTVVHVGESRDRRFGTERRVRHSVDGVTRRADVRVVRRPSGAPSDFSATLETQIDRWAAVGDVEGVVPVVDHGEGGRAWVASASTGGTLRGRDLPSVARALRQATRLADALSTLHERGVVHAGLDPDNVAFTAGPEGPLRPALHNPGLVDVYRRYEDPASVLDPRYAAPEYFEADRGIVDRATDIYGLGAVCFRLFTGVAPVAGSAESIAECVTDDDPLPRPSHVEPRLPEAVDEVVLRATATDKFDRFDTAGEFHDALAAVRDGVID